MSCREEDNLKAYNNIKDIQRPENKNDDNGSIFGLFGGGGDDEESDSGYSYEPASSVKESSGEWSFLGWSGTNGDYSVDTSTDYDSSSDYESSSGYDSTDYGGGSDSGAAMEVVTMAAVVTLVAVLTLAAAMEVAGGRRVASGRRGHNFPKSVNSRFMSIPLGNTGRATRDAG